MLIHTLCDGAKKKPRSIIGRAHKVLFWLDNLRAGFATRRKTCIKKWFHSAHPSIFRQQHTQCAFDMESIGTAGYAPRQQTLVVDEGRKKCASRRKRRTNTTTRTRQESEEKKIKSETTAQQYIEMTSRLLIDTSYSMAMTCTLRREAAEAMMKKKKKEWFEPKEQRLETIYHSSDRSPLSAWCWWVSEQEVAVDGMDICLVIA